MKRVKHYFSLAFMAFGFCPLYAGDKETTETHTSETELSTLAGTEVDELDEEGKTELMHACERGQLELARELLVMGASPYILSKSGLSALHYAAESENDELLIVLVNEWKMPVDHPGLGKITALHWACVKESILSIEVLLDLGADLKAIARYSLPHVDGTRIRKDFDCLGWSLYKNKREIIEHIINLDEQLFQEAMVLVTTNHWFESLNTLVELQPSSIRDYLVANHESFSEPMWAEATRVAICYDMLDVLEVLVKSRPHRAQEVLISACDYGKNLSAVRFLFDNYNLNPLVQDAFGSTLLHFAAKAGSSALINYLLTEHPLMPNPKNMGGYTALHVASATGNLEAVQILAPLAPPSPTPARMQMMRRVWSAKVPKTPLEVAQENRSTQVIKYLTGWTEMSEQKP